MRVELPTHLGYARGLGARPGARALVPTCPRAAAHWMATLVSRDDLRCILGSYLSPQTRAIALNRILVVRNHLCAPPDAIAAALDVH